MEDHKRKFKGGIQRMKKQIKKIYRWYIGYIQQRWYFQNIPQRRYNMNRYFMHLIFIFILACQITNAILYVNAMGGDIEDDSYTELITDVASRTIIPVVNTMNVRSGIIELPHIQQEILSSSTSSSVTKDDVEDISNDVIEVAVVSEQAIEVVERKPTPKEILNSNLGNGIINLGNSILTRYDLPDVYYPGMDYSSFQPYMDYRCVTNRKSPAYGVVHSESSYTDGYGMRRYKVDAGEFNIDGKDDYVIALGTFYKEKGTAGSRYLIVTTTGMYTAITGDEKADKDTDSKNMFSLHKNGSCAGIIEWIVDQRNLERSMRRAGTVTVGPIEELQGDILHIYKITP